MRYNDPKLYTCIYATDRHLPITDIKQIKRYDYSKLVLFLDGTAIGEGNLERVGRKNSRHVHTDGVSLDNKYRRKGHGIALYYWLIETARGIGATRIYSSTNLNNFSRNMWKNKLKKFGYKVKEKARYYKCDSCGNKHRCIARYYIELK